MLARLSSVFLVAIYTMPALVVASVVPRTEPTTNQCNTGSNQCCTGLHDVKFSLPFTQNNTYFRSFLQASDSVSSNIISGILGVAVGDIASGLLGSEQQAHLFEYVHNGFL